MCGRYTLASPTPADVRARFPVGESIEIARRYNVAPGRRRARGHDQPRGRAARRAAALGTRAVVGEVARHRAEDDQRARRDGGRAAGVPARVRALPLPDHRRRLLRVAAACRAAPSRRSTSRATTAGCSHSPGCGRSGTARTTRTIRSCTIMTTAANSAIASLHDRMPIILAPDAEAAWLDAAHASRRARSELLHGLPPAQTALRAGRAGGQRRALRRPRVPRAAGRGGADGAVLGSVATGHLRHHDRRRRRPVSGGSSAALPIV